MISKGDLLAATRELERESPTQPTGLTGWKQLDGTGRIIDYAWPERAVTRETVMGVVPVIAARLPRFGASTARVMSVAEHMTRCYQLARGMWPEAPAVARQCLIHDAAESYLGCDVPRPFKSSLPAYIAVEDRILAAVCRVLDLDFPFDPRVKDVDTIMLVAEAHAGYEVITDNWTSRYAREIPQGIVTYIHEHGYWDAEHAERAYKDALRTEFGV